MGSNSGLPGSLSLQAVNSASAMIPARRTAARRFNFFMQCSFYKMQGPMRMHRAFCFHFTAARQGSSMASVPVFCRDFWAERKKAPGGAGRFGMRAACALRIFSGRIIFISRLSRSAERSKRIFTGGVATVSGIYRKQDRKKPRRAGALRGNIV